LPSQVIAEQHRREPGAPGFYSYLSDEYNSKCMTTLSKQQYEMLVQELNQLLRQFNQIGLIALGSPDDEYEAEAGTILPRIRTTKDEEEMTRTVYEEFAHWFGDQSTTGPESSYAALGKAVWQLKSKYFG